MYWNHRVVKKHYKKYDETDYTIHEVYYNDKGEICAMTENPTYATSDSVEGLQITLQRMLDATKEPIIDADTIVYAKSDW